MRPALSPGPKPREPSAESDEASQAEEQKRAFLRLVSHELRTPLNSILGFSEILASELYGPLGAPQYRQYAEIIRSSGVKLLKLVNQVVEIARLQAGDIAIELRSEPLAPLIEEVAAPFGDEIRERRLRLVVAPCGETHALGDARALRTVLAGLLQNAVSFSPEDGEIRIHAEVSATGVAVVIVNEGVGVHPDELDRLRRPFEQGENALTRQVEGGGLGLAICDLTCQAMGAELSLASDPGRSFTAKVVLPRA